MGKTFAEIKWEQVQLEAATAWANLDISIEMIENNKDDLTDEQYAEIMAKVEEQQEYIQNHLLTAKVTYEDSLKVNKKGDTNDVRSGGAK